MDNHEFFQAAPQLLHQVKELVDLGSRTNLLKTLTDLGHPYGLLLQPLLNQPSILERSVNSSVDNEISQQSISPVCERFDQLVSLMLKSDSNPNPLHKSAIFIWGDKHNNFSMHPSQESLLFSSSFGGLASSSHNSDSSGEWASRSTDASMGALDNLNQRRTMSISKDGLILGTVTINLRKYPGREAFLVKTSRGEPLIEIKPQNDLAFIHLNREPRTLRQLSPLERIQTMTQDLKEVFSLIDNPIFLDGLNPEQQAVLTAARSAVIVGISHLVPIFRRRTGLPFWKLDVLPQAIQQLHRLDSQAVSNQFGGNRRVRVEDVEMMVITPQMRQQLATAF